MASLRSISKRLIGVSPLLVLFSVLSACGKVSGIVETGSETALAPCVNDSVTSGPCKVDRAGVTVTATIGSNVTTWTNPSAGTTVTAVIPNGIYSNADVEFTEPQLLPAKIVAGSTIFGVVGTAIATPSVCATNGLQGANCAATAGTYWTNLLGTNVTGANGSLSVTIPQGYHSGATTATAADTNLTAVNIRSGTAVFGVTGSLTPAYSACTDDTLNAGQCSTATNRYVTPTLGSNVTISGSTSTTIPLAFYSGTQTCSVSDANLAAANIKNGISILGVAGSYLGSTGASQMSRDKATTQISQTTESGAGGTAYTNADPGYRAVPKIAKDDEGLSGGSVTYVNRTGWSTTTCGTSGTIAARIADCATVFGANATWDGATLGNMGQGRWKLVARTGDVTSSKGRETWQDQRTGLLWSSLVATSLNWCKASGSNYISGNPMAEDDPSNYCDNASYQATSGLAISACFEDGGTYFTTTDGSIDNAGKAGLNLASTPSVAWRLPTRGDYMLAEVNGIRFVMPDMGTSGTTEWSTSVRSNSRINAWYFTGNYGNWNSASRDTLLVVRCVGR